MYALGTANQRQQLTVPDSALGPSLALEPAVQEKKHPFALARLRLAPKVLHSSPPQTPKYFRTVFRLRV